MNRRDNTTNFHAGGWVIQQILAQYVALGMDLSKANIGFPMYAKWFAYNSTTCTADMPINCTGTPVFSQCGNSSPAQCLGRTRR